VGCLFLIGLLLLGLLLLGLARRLRCRLPLTLGLLALALVLALLALLPAALSLLLPGTAIVVLGFALLVGHLLSLCLARFALLLAAQLGPGVVICVGVRLRLGFGVGRLGLRIWNGLFGLGLLKPLLVGLVLVGLVL